MKFNAKELIYLELIRILMESRGVPFDPFEDDSIVAKALYESYKSEDDGTLYEIKEEFREGEVETSISTEYSRHYESRSVASLCFDQWVGWTYWYGGGKHAEPEAIDWISEAYFLDCEEKEVIAIQQTFSKLV